MDQTVHIIDVKCGNLQSLSNAIKRIGDYKIVFIEDASDFTKYDDSISKLIFPGVGNYGHFVKELSERNLFEPIRTYIESGRDIMGICVGLQAFFKSSEESKGIDGMNLLDLDLLKFSSNDPCFAAHNQLKSIPHIGWNTISEIHHDSKIVESNTTLFNLNVRDKYYFVHSYAAILKDEKAVEKLKAAEAKGWDFALSKYGSETFLAAVAYKGLFATQFHPEKSGVVGLKIIKAFLEGQKFSESNDISTSSVEGLETTVGGLSRRIIACLDVRTNDSGDLVVTKGDQYNVRETSESGESNVRNLGKPVELATKYYLQGADEITFLNITSFRNSPIKDLPMLEVLKRSAAQIFVPLTVGGGIKDMVDPVTGELYPAVKIADLYFRSGADKVSIGSEAVTIAESYYANGKKKTGKSAIETISSCFGNQAVVISVDPKRKYVSNPSDTSMSVIKIEDPNSFGPNGEEYCYYQVTSQGGRKIHDLGALELCLACEDLGAGEILLNSIDYDGTNMGFNLQLLRQIKENVSIPVIASSGAGKPEHFEEVFKMDCGVDAALGAGMFHRGDYDVLTVKKYLQEHGNMDVRIDNQIEL
ncbi:imidazoleglycerol phosphate synthase, cyclase subunit [Clavispora lusitaniae]|uniref:imidazoleglycerol phosphate synthase, cyclase subunit n=1 Tax=Clavispora lusitaniae TaxID=36911 RepID=UPI00202C8F44|nr:imidazoleglycerol phosphate synthase, cyclase subunit [Clavispora lusitaniae]